MRFATVLSNLLISFRFSLRDLPVLVPDLSFKCLSFALSYGQVFIKWMLNVQILFAGSSLLCTHTAVTISVKFSPFLAGRYKIPESIMTANVFSQFY